jgi:hypothetical protein
MKCYSISFQYEPEVQPHPAYSYHGHAHVGAASVEQAMELVRAEYRNVSFKNIADRGRLIVAK